VRVVAGYDNTGPHGSGLRSVAANAAIIRHFIRRARHLEGSIHVRPDPKQPQCLQLWTPAPTAAASSLVATLIDLSSVSSIGYVYIHLHIANLHVLCTVCSKIL
jgi:hypothetical protein